MHAPFALLAFAEQAANFLNCVCPAFSYFTTSNAIADNCTTSQQDRMKTLDVNSMVNKQATTRTQDCLELESLSDDCRQRQASTSSI